ncbi:MAG TPA: hypothetical protein VIT42_05035 [Microlunatus sp.]
MLIECPWVRVKSPALIPDGDLRTELARLDDLQFAELIRSHLVPRDPQPDRRARWQQLWTDIDQDAHLAERTFDVLEQFLDASEAAMEDSQLESVQRQRAQKFHRFCNDAWHRLQGSLEEDEPLSWAGRAAVGFNRPARRVIEQLVQAIGEHRGAVLNGGPPPSSADRRLWTVLRRVGLDPDGVRR